MTVRVVNNGEKFTGKVLLSYKEEVVPDKRPMGWNNHDTFVLRGDEGITRILLKNKRPTFSPFKDHIPDALIASKDRASFMKEWDEKEDLCIELYEDFATHVLSGLHGFGLSMDKRGDVYPLLKFAHFEEYQDDNIMIGSTLKTHALVLKTSIYALMKSFTFKILKCVLKVPFSIKDSMRIICDGEITDNTRRIHDVINGKTEPNMDDVCLILQDASVFSSMFEVFGETFRSVQTTVNVLCDTFIDEKEWTWNNVGFTETEYKEMMEDCSEKLFAIFNDNIRKLIVATKQYKKEDVVDALTKDTIDRMKRLESFYL